MAFDPSTDGFKFGMIGLQNTHHDETKFFTVEAQIGNKTFKFNKPDWNTITPILWRFVNQKNTLVSNQDLPPYANIVYRIKAFDYTTMETQDDYGFAV